ncbi:MAG: cyclodeaminase/cyclohydrolase family protein [Chloroflexota bacterium]
MTKTADITIQDFLDALGGNQSTPGGGGASALTGAQAAALVGMVIHFTLGKKKYADVQEEMAAILTECEALRAQLTTLADKDVEAFNSVVAGYGLPKATDEEKAARTAVIQAGLQKAYEVSLEIAEASMNVLKLSIPVGSKGNSNVVSDAATGAYLAYAAIQGALINVKVNLKFIKDEISVTNGTERATSVSDSATALLQEAKAACSQTLGIEV